MNATDKPTVLRCDQCGEVIDDPDPTLGYLHYHEAERRYAPFVVPPDDGREGVEDA